MLYIYKTSQLLQLCKGHRTRPFIYQRDSQYIGVVTSNFIVNCLLLISSAVIHELFNPDKRENNSSPRAHVIKDKASCNRLTKSIIELVAVIMLLLTASITDPVEFNSTTRVTVEMSVSQNLILCRTILLW